MNQDEKKIGICADHGGYTLKAYLFKLLKGMGYEVTDFGAVEYQSDDDYPDFVIPMAQAVGRGELKRGIAVCGSGVGAAIAANKVHNVRAALIHDYFSAHQGVEDDDMNVLCLGGRTIGEGLAGELTEAFLKARFSGAERHKRRLTKIKKIENESSGSGK